MTAENDKDLVWEKLSTVYQPEDEWMSHEYILSKRYRLAKYLGLSINEVDELIDGVSSERE